MVKTFHAPAFVVLCVSFVGFVSSCDNLSPTGEDSWKHYENGGMFVTASPSLSPTGKYMVYASACTGHGDIYVMKESARDPVRLTDNDDFESSPMFTPDGTRIVFVREHDQSRHVWIMNSDGTHASQLTQGNTLDDPLCLSGDGRYLLFARSIRSVGLGSVSHTYLMRIDEAADKPINLGGLAIFSPNSRFAIYSDAGGLWRLELEGKESARRRIYGTGWPVDTSEDGKFVLVERRSTGKTWTGDEEIWVLDTDRKSEKQLAIGNSAILFGVNRDNVLFFTGTDQIPYVTTIDGGPTKRIACPSTYKTNVRRCWDGSGVIVGSYAKTRGPEYAVIFIDFKELRATTIASIACNGSTFQVPIKTLTE